MFPSSLQHSWDICTAKDVDKMVVIYSEYIFHHIFRRVFTTSWKSAGESLCSLSHTLALRLSVLLFCELLPLIGELQNDAFVRVIAWSALSPSCFCSPTHQVHFVLFLFGCSGDVRVCLFLQASVQLEQNLCLRKWTGGCVLQTCMFCRVLGFLASWMEALSSVWPLLRIPLPHLSLPSRGLPLLLVLWYSLCRIYQSPEL